MLTLDTLIDFKGILMDSYCEAFYVEWYFIKLAGIGLLQRNLTCHSAEEAWEKMDDGKRLSASHVLQFFIMLIQQKFLSSPYAHC